jgi:hypothetical protein
LVEFPLVVKPTSNTPLLTVPESLQAVDLFFLRVLTPANALARR